MPTFREINDANLATFQERYSISGANLHGTAAALRSGMTIATSFRDLQVWQESMLLVEDIYRITQKFPREERYGLTSQLREAAISIPSNIGEGARRKRRKAFLNHLDIALGSQGEVDVQVEVGKRLNFVPSPSSFMCSRGSIESVGC